MWEELHNPDFIVCDSRRIKEDEKHGKKRNTMDDAISSRTKAANTYWKQDFAITADDLMKPTGAKAATTAQKEYAATTIELRNNTKEIDSSF